ncbi:MAG: hypothetical protein JOZ73_11860 [Solirubrobacterales bacterium]|nr:hypothetical protein [Solirubrobacterales bacterium]
MREVGQAQRAVSELRPASVADLETVSFCGRCGARAEVVPESRVCESCNMGLLLEARAKQVPPEGGAFLVIDDSMSVCGVSEAAEQILATTETDAVNRHLTEVLVPADVELAGPANLAVAITWAARGDDGSRRVFVRPANTFGLRMPARISSCGPPKAALLVFE